jgi:hypothetical protein
MLEEQSFLLCQGSNLDPPVVQSVVRHVTVSRGQKILGQQLFGTRYMEGKREPREMALRKRGHFLARVFGENYKL